MFRCVSKMREPCCVPLPPQSTSLSAGVGFIPTHIPWLPACICWATAWPTHQPVEAEQRWVRPAHPAWMHFQNSKKTKFVSEKSQNWLFFLTFPVTTDPALEAYTPDSIFVTLVKTELGVGLSFDGGKESRFGNRPIVVKKVFPGATILHTDNLNKNCFKLVKRPKMGELRQATKSIALTELTWAIAAVLRRFESWRAVRMGQYNWRCWNESVEKARILF